MSRRRFARPRAGPRFGRAGPELIVMGLLAALCGLALAALLSAVFGAHSAGPPAALRTVAAPAPDLGKLRQAVHAERPSGKVRHHRKRVHRVRSHHRTPAAPPPSTVAQAPTDTAGPTYQSPQPVKQFSAPTTPAPVRKHVVHRKPTGSTGGGSGGSFDDSG